MAVREDWTEVCNCEMEFAARCLYIEAAVHSCCSSHVNHGGTPGINPRVYIVDSPIVVHRYRVLTQKHIPNPKTNCIGGSFLGSQKVRLEGSAGSTMQVHMRMIVSGRELLRCAADRIFN